MDEQGLHQLRSIKRNQMLQLDLKDKTKARGDCLVHAMQLAVPDLSLLLAGPPCYGNDNPPDSTHFNKSSVFALFKFDHSSTL